MEKLFRYIIRIRWIVLLLVLLITVFMAFQIPQLRINSDVISSLPDSDPDAVLLKKIGAKFGGNRTGMIILESEDIFTTEGLKHVAQVTDTISEIEGISSVTSLTNIMDIKADESGLEIGKLINRDDLPDSPEEISVLKEKVISNENFKGTIVSADATSTVIVFTIAEEADMQSVANVVKKKSESLRLPERIFFAGSPMLITSISHLISSDLSRLLPIAFILILVVLYIGFRSFRGLVLPLLTAVLAIIWVLGIMAISGAEINMVSNNIPIVLLAVGTAYAIHVINRIDQVRSDLNQSITVALTYVTIPVILAALTTIGGFLSFIFGSYLKMIMDFGLYTALGTFFALVLSIFFIPAVISAFRWEKSSKITKKDEGEITFFSRYMHLPLHTLLFKHTKAVLAAWIFITLISIAGIFQVKRNVDIRNYFKKENPTRIAEDIMTQKFGGSKPVFVLFKGDIQDPEILNKMLQTEQYMKMNPGITATQSIAGLIADINGALGEGRQIPDNKEKIEQLWFLFDGNESVSKLVSEDLDEAIIISKFLSPENKERKEFSDYMMSFIKQNSSAGCSIEITGMPFIETTMDRSLIKSQAGSLIIAILFVILIVSIILKSTISGFYAAVPIISTILILFGVMGFTGIPLNIATVLVASIAMGIGIDYSIHVITHFNVHMDEGDSISKSLDQTIAVSGKAILINVLSVSAGFLVLLFSEMVPLQYFGLLISLSMVGSGLSAMTFLPAILILAHRKKELQPVSLDKNV